MVKVHIGVDISKDWIDFATFDQTLMKSSFTQRVENKGTSIRSFLKKLIKDHALIHVVFEHTGAYGLVLEKELTRLGITYSVVPAYEIKMSLGIRRGKSDVIDAMRIAEYAAINDYKLKPSKMRPESILKIKELLAYRSQLRKVCSSFKNSLKAHSLMIKETGLNSIVSDIKKQIQAFEKKIKDIESQIHEIVQTNKDLNTNYQLLLSIKGVGKLIAYYMLVVTDNFTRFNDPRKFNCYSGLAPFEHTSGSSVRGKTMTQSLANKMMKTIIRNGVNSAIMYDPQLKTYYKRKTEEGKSKNIVKNAVACKLVYRMFAVIKRQSPFILLAN